MAEPGAGRNVGGGGDGGDAVLRSDAGEDRGGWGGPGGGACAFALCFEKLHDRWHRNESFVFATGYGGSSFEAGGITTSFLEAFEYQRSAIDVIEPGTQTTVQDYPGRSGYWHVGVPPSGPMDALAFRIANRLVGNLDSVAGLEIAVTGPTLQFASDGVIALTGADFGARLDGTRVPLVAVDSGFGGFHAGDDDGAGGGEPRVSGDFGRRGCAGIFGKPQHFYPGRFWRACGAGAARGGRGWDHGGRAALLLHAEGSC